MVLLSGAEISKSSSLKSVGYDQNMFEISESTILRKEALSSYSSIRLVHKVDNFTLLKFQHNLYTFKSYQLKLYVQWQIEIYIKIDLTDNYIQFMFI